MTIPPSILSDPPWLFSPATEEDIVLATVGRLVRNVSGLPFPGWSTAESRAELVKRAMPALSQVTGFRKVWHADMSELRYEQRRALLMRKLITPCMAARGEGCHIFVSRRRDATLMLNEEEHIVLHTFRAGEATDVVVSAMERAAAELNEALHPAYDPAYGYLTSLPGEAGDGMQLYQVVHLPALIIAGMMEQVTRAIDKLHLNISPFYSDGDEESGNTYIIYSVPGPEGSIRDLADYFDAVMAHLVQRERQVRSRLTENDPERLMDDIGRAYGLLRYAHRLSLPELRRGASLLRLATTLGVLVWDIGPAEAIEGLRKTVLSPETAGALSDPTTEPLNPAAYACGMRAYLESTPHHFQPLKTH